MLTRGAVQRELPIGVFSLVYLVHFAIVVQRDQIKFYANYVAVEGHAVFPCLTLEYKRRSTQMRLPRAWRTLSSGTIPQWCEMRTRTWRTWSMMTSLTTDRRALDDRFSRCFQFSKDSVAWIGHYRNSVRDGGAVVDRRSSRATIKTRSRLRCPKAF